MPPPPTPPFELENLVNFLSSWPPFVSNHKTSVFPCLKISESNQCNGSQISPLIFRYELTKIQSVLENYKKETHSRICETDVLIVDEVSMLSQKQFELVEKAGAVKNHNLLFGGIQVILSGDFYQLPPIRNLLYHDDGKFCFQSAIFQQAIPHRIVLDEVIRQNDPQFIKVVNEISVGKVSSDTEKFVKGLSGDFCSQTSDSLKLYATNDLVEQHNRDSIIRWPGEMFEYTSNDFGKLDSLHRILAPPVLWLKKECPVILLQNISGKLFNGLRGSVVSCDNDGPTVHFQSVNITRKLKKESFSGIVRYLVKLNQ